MSSFSNAEDARFCSEAHRLAYEQDLERIALGRLAEMRKAPRDRYLDEMPEPPPSGLLALYGPPAALGGKRFRFRRYSFLRPDGVIRAPNASLRPPGGWSQSVLRDLNFASIARNPLVPEGFSFHPEIPEAPENPRDVSIPPKGFVASLPILPLKPTFDSLRGDHLMAETLTRNVPNGENSGVSEENPAGRPANTLHDHLTMARRASAILSERRLREITARHGLLETLDAAPVLEWLSTTQLRAQTLGFVFENDGPVQIGPMVMASPKPKAAAKPNVTQKVPVRKPEPKKAPEVPTPREAEGLPFRPNRVPLSRGKAFHTDPIPASALRIHMPALWQNPLHPSMMLGLSPEAEKAAAEARHAEPDLFIPEPDMLDPDVELLIGQAAEQGSPKTETKSTREGRRSKRRHDAEVRAAAQEKAAQERAAQEKAAQEKAAQEKSTQEKDKAAQEKAAHEQEAPSLAAEAGSVEVAPVAVPEAPTESKLTFAPPSHSQLSFATTTLLSLDTEQPVEEDQTPITLPNILFVDQQPIVQHWFVRLPVIAKMGLIIGVLAVIAGIGMIINSTLKDEQQQAAKAQARLPHYEVGSPIVGDTGWQPDYVTDATGVRRRQLAFFRASTGLTDYRVEFQGEIEYKALAWVVRASDTKNFYSMKLYVAKPGAEPVVNFQRYAVVRGKEGEKVEKPLPFKVALDTVYRVRVDAFNDKITTRIQGEVVDEWTDSQITGGAFGTSNEMGERGQIRNVQMWNLRPRAK